jgi:flagellar M-ring protein FliF
MPNRVTEFVQPMRDKWDNVDGTHKVWIIAAFFVVLIALALAIFFATRTTYKVAHRSTNHIEAITIANNLEEHGIRNRISQDGIDSVVEVEQGAVRQAQFLIETMGLTGGRNFHFEDALDFSGIGATETMTRNNLQRARQTDLEEAISVMDGVLWARVEMQLQDPNRFFIQSQRPSRASVILQTTRQLSRAEGAVIARFVSRSVVGLELENIEVVDSNFNVLFSGLDLEEEDSILPDLQGLMVRQRIEMSNRVKDLFSARFDKVEVAPSLGYSQQFSQLERVNWAAPIAEMEAGLVLSEHVLSASARGMQPGWEPGLMPNASVIPSYPFASTAEMSASQNEHTRSFALDEIRQTVTDMPSSFIPEVSSITVGLHHVQIYDQSHARFNGYSQAEWETFVSGLPRFEAFDDANGYLEGFAREIANATGIPLDNVSVYAWVVPHVINYYETPPNVGQILMFIVLALLLAAIIFALISRTRPQEDEDYEPELSVEDLLVSTQMEEAIDEDYLDPIGYEETNAAKQKLEAFIDEKPDAAASLLRHWLNEAEF